MTSPYSAAIPPQQSPSQPDTRLDALETAVSNLAYLLSLTTTEVSQLANINTSIFTSARWVFLAGLAIDDYYTEDEVDTLLTGKSDTTHDHDSDYSAIGHDHNSLYFTEAETDARIGGYLLKYGLTLSNNGSDANNDIDISVGRCSDSTGAYQMILSSGLTKRLDAAWSAGTGNGGLDTGSKANSTWYYVYLIRKDSDGSIDALFSASATSPTIPAGYTYSRRIGAIRTNGSGNIMGFIQTSNRFMYKTPQDETITDNPGTNVVTMSLTIPPISIIAIVNVGIQGNGSNGTRANIGGPSDTMAAPSTYVAMMYCTTNGFDNSEFQIATTDGTTRYRLGYSESGIYVRYMARGWIDTTI